MISAFGVDHGDEIGKSLKPQHVAALKRVNWKGHPKTFPPDARYAGSKLGANQWGKEKAKLGGKKNPTGYYIDGPTSARIARYDLEPLNTKKPGRKLP